MSQTELNITAAVEPMETTAVQDTSVHHTTESVKPVRAKRVVKKPAVQAVPTKPKKSAKAKPATRSSKLKSNAAQSIKLIDLVIEALEKLKTKYNKKGTSQRAIKKVSWQKK